MTNIKFKNDKYKKARGGYSKLLQILCVKCGEKLFYYQKDGPGIIKRMYLDRIFESTQYSDLENKTLKEIPQLVCPNCHELIGIPNIYRKENRLVFIPLVGKIIKRNIK